MDGVSGLSEQAGSAATAGQQDSQTEHSIARQASFDAGSQDNITVNTNGRKRQPSRTPEDERPVPVKRSSGGRPAVQQSQYEECELCGQRFRGNPKHRKQHLKRHKESKHENARFHCNHAGCRSNYNRVDNLHDHEKKCHGFVLQQPEGRNTAATLGVIGAQTVASGRGSEMDEPPDSADLHGGGPYRVAVVARESATDAHHQARSHIEAHFGTFGYSISTEERGWCPPRDPEDWDMLMAGVSGGTETDVGSPGGGHEAGTPEDGFNMGLGLAPRPLDIPCAPWRVLGG
ncbi:hypothetical protein Daus18300_003162 [Diaporthe australafricana]|uniref:C2H2-type domain-containing protein n=1 Tax=Diaporthe australafricana TaxID=127596 RepID=A0ABR3XHI0_9PEZI